jgi:transposase
MARTKRGGPAAQQPTARTLTRPDRCEAQRLRAAELFAQGRAPTEVAAMMGVTYEAARRWRARWQQGGTAALRRRTARGRPPKLSDHQAEQVRQALLAGAQAAGFATDLWTLDRVVAVIQHTTGVKLSRPSAWRLLTGRLGWSLQRPERQAKERDEEAITRWVAYEWPRIKKGPPKSPHGESSWTNRASPCCRSPAGPGRPGASPDPDPPRQLEAGLHGRSAWLPRQRPRARARLCFHLKPDSYKPTR